MVFGVGLVAAVFRDSMVFWTKCSEQALFSGLIGHGTLKLPESIISLRSARLEAEQYSMPPPEQHHMGRCPLPTSASSNYKVVKVIGDTSGINRGGMNGGVFIVKHVMTGELAVEKRLKHDDVKNIQAQRDIDYLRQITEHDLTKNITALKAVVYRESNLTCSVFLKYCELGNLGELGERHWRRIC
ncbi:hypothetical protein BDV96DRAFT_640681 [Lophiotrema nucula]|uniref:Protein kinase domain-containing protein n=1 Tax=Lophiotrema nucula TaxID=690887 RepID=A0A6A5ZQ62_9PLEO|nr:hypothetical protein BDV96DRAFT_640681 [Lophiotrema nucula]